MDDIDQKLERVLGSLVDYRIKFELIAINYSQNKLGQGGYGDVWLGEMTLESESKAEDGQVATKGVAVKTLRQVMGTKEELTLTACQLARELKVWAGLQHRNILELVGFYLSDTLENAWLLSPYEPEGNLAEFLEKKKPNEKRKLELVFDALCGLRYLHSHSPTIVHGDLKPANIIVGLDGYAKLCDFGLAKALDEPTGLTTAGAAQGTPRYMSPELVEEENAVATLGSDIWAFACVAGEVLTGHTPYYPEKAHVRIVVQIIKGKDPIPLNRFSLPVELEAWIRKCWNSEASDRPSVLDCVDCLERHMAETFPDSSRLTEVNDPSLVMIPTQTDDFFVELHRKKLRNQPKDHPEYATTLTNLAFALTERYEANTEPGDLEEAITYHRHALQLRPIDHPERRASLRNLAWVLFRRIQLLPDTKDTNEMVALGREAMELSPVGHPERSANLITLSAALNKSCDLSPAPEFCEESIGLCREALQLLSLNDRNRIHGLQSLMVALRARFRGCGDAKDREETIELGREALRLSPVGHPERSHNIINLVGGLSLNAKRSLDRAVFDECITLRREALQLCRLGHPDHHARLQELALALRDRFDTFGDAKDLEEAVERRREALALCPVGHPERSVNLTSLAIALSLSAKRSLDRAVFDESITLRREELRLCPLDHLDRGASLNNFGWELYERYELFGDDASLEEATTILWEGINLCPAGRPDRRYIVDSLGCVLHSDFKRHGDPKVLLEALRLLRKVVQLTKADQSVRAVYVMHLGSALVDSYKNGGNVKDIEEAIELHRDALQLRPGRDEDRYDSLMALGNSLRARSGTSDLGEARRLFTEAMELVPGDCAWDLRRQTVVKKLLDEMEDKVAAAGNKQSVAVDQVAQELEEVTLKDEETKG